MKFTYEEQREWLITVSAVQYHLNGYNYPIGKWVNKYIEGLAIFQTAVINELREGKELKLKEI